MSEIRCCLSCGRDTRSKSQICSRCYGRHKYDSQINDTKDRHILDTDLEISEDILDDDEYNYNNSRYNDKYGDNGKKNTDKFIDRMNKRK
jgi:hypothetical protein